jgi:hypothetical protein
MRTGASSLSRRPCPLHRYSAGTFQESAAPFPVARPSIRRPAAPRSSMTGHPRKPHPCLHGGCTRSSWASCPERCDGPKPHPVRAPTAFAQGEVGDVRRRAGGCCCTRRAIQLPGRGLCGMAQARGSPNVHGCGLDTKKSRPKAAFQVSCSLHQPCRRFGKSEAVADAQIETGRSCRL